jgi:hypothetical protein
MVNLLGLTILAAGLFGYFRMPLGLPLRLVLVASGVLITLLELYSVWPRIGLELIILTGLWFMPQLARVAGTAKEIPK